MAAAAEDPHIVTSVNYRIHKEGDEKPFVYMYQRRDGGPQSGGTRRRVDCKVFDGRARLAELTLDRHGVALVPHQSSLSHADFYKDPEKIHRVYYPEMEELLKCATGASRVIVFDHNVHNSRTGGRGPPPPGESAVAPAVFAAHNDYTSASAPQRVRDLARRDLDLAARDGSGGSHTLDGEPLIKAAELDGLLRGRYVFVNIWRNISDTPIQRNTLAVCDGSTAGERDFVDQSMIYRGRVGTTNDFVYSPAHRWLYFSRLRKGEAVLLKCFDSKPGVCRWTGHTAIDDPTGAPDAPPRECVAARCIPFFAPGDKEFTAEPAVLSAGAAASRL